LEPAIYKKAYFYLVVTATAAVRGEGRYVVPGAQVPVVPAGPALP